VDDPETALAALGRIYTEFVQKGRSLEDSRHRTDENVASLRETMDLLKNIRVSLPPDIISRNSSVLPNRVEDLAQFFRSQPDLTPFLPRRLGIKEPNGTNSRLRGIFQRVQITLAGVENDSCRFHSGIAASWIHQNPLRKIIEDRISYLRRRGETVVVREVISNIVDTIERDLRFHYVKLLRVYNDVLGVVLRERGDSVVADSLVPLHLYLECGASDPVVISLMSLGFSRMAALLLRRRIVLGAQYTPEELLERCRDAIRNAKTSDCHALSSERLRRSLSIDRTSWNHSLSIIETLFDQVLVPAAESHSRRGGSRQRTGMVQGPAEIARRGAADVGIPTSGTSGFAG
jgi:hypothetical protein